MSETEIIEKETKKKNIFSFLFNVKKREKVLLFIVIIVAILFFIFLFNNLNSNTISEESSSSDYLSNLEKRLSNTLSKIEGAGNVSVMITLESGMETILASKITTTESYSGTKEIVETPIIVNGKTVTIKENYPKVKGVLLVAEGANQIGVITKLQQATMSILSVNINQIEILTMK